MVWPFLAQVCLSSAYLYPAVASLVGFSCGPTSLVVPVWVSFCGGGDVFLSCSAWGRLLLSLFWCCFCALGRLRFSRRVLPQVTLGGSAAFLAPVACPAPVVEPCCWVGGVFGALLGFLPCAVLFLRGLQFAQLTLPQVALGGFLTFRSPGA